jgi:hypothetical protein
MPSFMDEYLSVADNGNDASRAITGTYFLLFDYTRTTESRYTRQLKLLECYILLY